MLKKFLILFSIFVICQFLPLPHDLQYHLIELFSVVVFIFIIYLIFKSIFKFFGWASDLTKTKCSKCNSTNIELEKVVEIDRWLGRVKVKEKMASGKIRERYVQRTMAKKRYYYCCQDCKHTYTTVQEVEL